MALLKSTEDKYISILREELVPALGCTEPICIAYAAAKARQVLGQIPDRVAVQCSGNIVKNVKGAVVPNSGGMKGIEAAAAIGITGGNANQELEVLTAVTPENIKQAKKLLDEDNFCTVGLSHSDENLYVKVDEFSGEHSSSVEVVHTHTNIARIEKDGKTIFKKDVLRGNSQGESIDRSCLNIKNILEFANTVELNKLSDILESQILYNSSISKEGLNKPYGARVGHTLLEYNKNDVRVRAAAAAASGSDARMSGCTLPVVINSGSGNQGITVSMPVIEYAKELKVSHEKLLRALIMSNLVAIHEKSEIGRLSAFCGAVSAACGSGAAITYLYDGSYEEICKTITNTLANVSGIICDGAKPSCAAKIASAVNAAILGHDMAMDDLTFNDGDGIVKSNVEDTIASVGEIGKVGMKETDQVILKIMVS